MPRSRSERRFTRRRRLAWVRPVLITVSLLAAFGSGTWLVAFSSVLDVRSVRVEGTSVLADAEVTEAARVPRGGPLARLDVDAIGARVRELRPVRDVAVHRSWPHTVVVAVTERTPVAALDAGSTYQLVDRAGVAYHEVAAPPAGLPTVTLTTSGTRTAPAFLRPAATVAAAIPPQLGKRLETIELQTRDSVTLRFTDGIEVMWGSAEASARKAEVLLALLRQRSESDDHPTHYDVSVPDRPTSA